MTIQKLLMFIFVTVSLISSVHTTDKPDTRIQWVFSRGEDLCTPTLQLTLHGNSSALPLPSILEKFFTAKIVVIDYKTTSETPSDNSSRLNNNLLITILKNNPLIGLKLENLCLTWEHLRTIAIYSGTLEYLIVKEKCSIGIDEENKRLMGKAILQKNPNLNIAEIDL